MSTNENLTQSDEVSSEQAITIQPSAVTAFPGSADWLPAGGSEPAQEGIGGMTLLHAVRRHWLVILSTGLACAAVTGFSIWLVMKPKYTAEAQLKLEITNPTILGKPTADQAQQNTNEFEIFRETQQGQIKSPYVIRAALRDPRLKNRDCVRREDAKHNANAWLADEIHADFATKNTEIMTVTATEPDRDDAAAIVNAVIDAYMNEVVNVEQQQRRGRLTELQQISGEKDNEVREKREQLKHELVNAGGDDQSASSKTTLAYSMYADFEREYERMRVEHRELLAKLHESKSFLQDLPGAEIPESEVAMILNTNPIYRDLQSRAALLEQMHRYREGVAVDGPKQKGSGMARTEAELTATKNQLHDLKTESTDQVRNAKRIELEKEIRRLNYEIEVSTEQMTGFEKEVEKKLSEANEMGKSTVNAAMQRSDVENLERILHNVAEERERLRVELNSAPRVSVVGDRNMPAPVPEHEARDLRVLFIFVGSFLAMLMPGVGIVLWDLQRGRINSASDVSKRLNLPVIGGVPLIPATVMRRLGDNTRRSQIWKLRFTEAIDCVAARLIRKAECDRTRVVLVTSALSGEGKTTLATQLAMSLARAHWKTVLVDFDLRQPTLDGALGLPLGPGVCEALRGDGDIVDMAQQTGTDRLSVVTAGAWNRLVLPTLSNGAVGTLLEQLRANFDFVIVDGSPILPIVDTRLASQHVDAVVLSVLRDVSQASKVAAALEMLNAFGVPCVEAVVIGGEEHGNAKALALHAATLGDQTAPAATETELLVEGNASKPNQQ